MRFTKLIDYAQRNSVKVAFENQRKLSNLAWVFENFSEEDGVGFCWDCGHENCFTPGKEYMPLFGDRLICTHIHDNYGIYNQDSHLLPFDGAINFRKVADAIHAAKFAGTLMLEVLPENSDRYDGMSLDAYLEKAAGAAKKLRDMVENL